MLKMFRRRRDARDHARDRSKNGLFRPTGELDSNGYSGAEQQGSIRKTGGATFELMPAARAGLGVVKSSHSTTDLSESRHSGRLDSNATFVSFINFDDAAAVKLHSPALAFPAQVIPAVVYTAGGKARSMYTVARPTSVRRFRDSATSQVTASRTPTTSVPPVPAMKLPSVKARHKQVPTFNVCIAGAPCSGKTSFIRLLCETLDIDKEKDGNRKALEAVRSTFGEKGLLSDPACITVTANTAFDQRIRLSLHKAESFAFGTDTTQNLQSDLRAGDLLRFIEARLDASIAQETAVVRTPLTSADSHIHACLYFLDQTCFLQPKTDNVTPHGNTHLASPSTPAISPHHLNVIKQLGKRVIVIPVIARADELSLSQLNHLRALLRNLTSSGIFMDPQSFSQPSGTENDRGVNGVRSTLADDVDSDEERSIPATPVIRSRSNSIHRQLAKRKNKRFSEIAIKPSDEDINKIFPLSLISPESFDLPQLPLEQNGDDQEVLPRFRRRFRYGLADVKNEEHCEFTGLKRVLLTTGWKTLKDMTEEKFEEFRTERLHERQARSRTRTITSDSP